MEKRTVSFITTLRCQNRTGNIIVMIAFVCAIAAAFVTVPGEARADEALKFKVYGFLRFDIMSSDSRMNNNLVPMWVLNEYTPDAIKDDASLAYHPRLTRVGMKFQGHPLSDKWSLDGGVEIDFQVFDAGSESRQVPRMRLGFMRLNYNDLHILAGQHWDVISTLYPNVNLNGVNWNAGNTGDRRPQLRVTFSPEVGNGNIRLTGALTEAGAVNMSDVDKNGVPDGIDSSVPMLQGWFGTEQNMGENGSIKAGVWGHYWEEKDLRIPPTVPEIGDTTLADLTSWSVGIDLRVQAVEWLMFQGEAWTGETLGDIRGGIGQTINADGEAIGATGGWVEADISLGEKFVLIGGYTMDDVKDDDISDGMRAKNQAPYGALRWKPFKKLMLSCEYIRFETTYKSYEETSVNNHIDLNMMYFF